MSIFKASKEREYKTEFGLIVDYIYVNSEWFTGIIVNHETYKGNFQLLVQKIRMKCSMCYHLLNCVNSKFSTDFA